MIDIVTCNLQLVSSFKSQGGSVQLGNDVKVDIAELDGGKQNTGSSDEYCILLIALDISLQYSAFEVCSLAHVIRRCRFELVRVLV